MGGTWRFAHGKPHNPFINAGVIVATDFLRAGHGPREGIGGILRFVRDDDDIRSDP